MLGIMIVRQSSIYDQSPFPHQSLSPFCTTGSPMTTTCIGKGGQVTVSLGLLAGNMIPFQKQALFQSSNNSLQPLPNWCSLPGRSQITSTVQEGHMAPWLPPEGDDCLGVGRRGVGPRWNGKQAQDLREPNGQKSRPKACENPQGMGNHREAWEILGQTTCLLGRYYNAGLCLCARLPRASPTPEAPLALLDDLWLTTHQRNQGWKLLSEAIIWMPEVMGRLQVINSGFSIAGNYSS